MPIYDCGHSTVPASALLLALGSAVLHAAWNLLVARARDVQAATAATFLLSIAIAAPFAAIWWSAEPSVWPYALASTLLEIAYVVALAHAYRTTDLSFVYPLTRGLAPVLTLVASVAILGHGIGATETAGVLVVAAGVVLVSSHGGHGDARALLVVATIAASIAAYTLVDRVGIQHAGALTYFVLVLAGPCLVYPPLVGREAIRRELGAGTVLAGIANVGSFALGLLALRYGPAAPVLAVRSSSIVLATLLAGRLLAERVARSRIAGSVLVFAGVVLLAL
jgi:drug/metabolite transporter (DMT)-like permease